MSKVMCECGAGPMSEKHRDWWHKKNSKQHQKWARLGQHRYRPLAPKKKECEHDWYLHVADPENGNIMGCHLCFIRMPESAVMF